MEVKRASQLLPFMPTYNCWRSGKLETTREQLQQHVKRQYSNTIKDAPLETSGYVPRPAQPTAEFNITSPKLGEVRQVVKKAFISTRPQWSPLQALQELPQGTRAARSRRPSGRRKTCTSSGSLFPTHMGQYHTS